MFVSGTNHIAFHVSATAWCLGPAGFGSVFHLSCSLSPICSAFVGAFGRFWFCLLLVEQEKNWALKGSDVKNTEFQILKGIAPVIPWAK